MSGIELATGYVSLVISGTEVTPGVKKALGAAEPEADKAGAKAGSRFKGSFSKGLKSGAALLGAGAIGAGTISFLKDSIAEAREAQKVGAQTANVIRSTGGAAKVTAKQVGDLATSISNKTGIDDEAVQSASNLLLTFTNLRNEVGKGNDIFNQATQIATDMGAALGSEPKAAAIQLGKALNDPVKGIAALGRVGVSFTAQQKKQIKTLVESGDTMKAQKIILRELGKEFGGSAAAQATAGEKAAVAVGNLKEQIGTALLPIVDKLATFTSNEVVPAISEFVTGMQDGTGAGGEVAGVLKDVLSVGKGVLGFFNAIPGPVKKYGAGLALAALVMGKLNGGMLASQGRFAGLTSSMRTAEGRAAAFTKTMGGVRAGVRNVAGAGGMMLLADATQETSKSMGALKGAAGGAAVGLAFAGPAGAAVGGLAGATVGLLAATDDAGEAAKVHIGSWKDYESTLEGVTAATTEQTRAMVYQRLESSGLLEATRELGLTDRQAVNAVLGKKGALEATARALKTNTTLSQEQRDAIGKETGAIYAAREAQLRRNVALARNSEELRNAKKALRNFMEEPSNKRINVSGTSIAIVQLNGVRAALQDVFNLSKKVKTAGPGGIEVLLGGADGNPATPRRHGGPVTAGQPYVVGETRPELFVPNQSGRIVPRVPTASTTSSPAGGVEMEQAMYRGTSRALADNQAVIMRKDDADALDLLVGAS